MRPTQRHRRLILVVLCVSLLVVSLDSMVLNVALPTIDRAMHASSSELQWFVDAYIIVFASLLLVVGSLGDRLGRKWVFLAGLVIFAVGSACAAFSDTPDRLIASRAFMGIGGAAIMPSTLSILTNVFEEADERARAIGIWSGTSGLGVALGPMAGGFLLAHYWWGSVFLINVPIVMVGLMATIWIVPNSKADHTKPPDPVGAAISMVGMGVLLWGIIEAPGRGWSSPSILGALVGAFVVLATFVFWELRSKHPMLEMSFFRSARFSAAIVAMTMILFSLMGVVFMLTQYLQFVLGYSALQTGLRVAPIAVVLLVVAPLSSVLVRHLGTKVVVFSGMVGVVTGMSLLSYTTIVGTYGDVLPALFLLGIGMGLAFAPSTESVMGSLSPDQTGVGSATNGAAMQTGGALGVGVLGSILDTRYVNRLTPLLAGRGVPSSIQHLVTGSLGGALAVAGQVGGALGEDLAHAARSAFLSGMDVAAVVGAVVVGLAAIVVLVALPSRASKAEAPQPPTSQPPTSQAGLSGSSERGESSETRLPTTPGTRVVR